MHKLYKAVQSSFQVVLAKGGVCAFVGNQFHTGNKEVIAELDKMIVDAPHMGIYVDENEPEVDPNALSPTAIIEAKVRAKILAEMAEANNPANDRGNTVQGNFANSINNTDKVEEAATGIAPEVKAELAALTAQKSSSTLEAIRARTQAMATEVPSATVVPTPDTKLSEDEASTQV